MQVEITKIVYQHPWYVSSAPPPVIWPVGGCIYKPHWESSRWGWNPIFCYWPNADHVLTECVRSSQPLELQSTDRTLPASGHLPPDASGRKFAALEPLCTRSDAVVLCPVGLSPAFVCCCCCRASDRSIRSLFVSVRSQLWARFFMILHAAWFLSSCLDFAWYLESFLVLLRSCLRCWSSDHHIAFVQVHVLHSIEL